LPTSKKNYKILQNTCQVIERMTPVAEAPQSMAGSHERGKKMKTRTTSS
jgi:hypothetical protein